MRLNSFLLQALKYHEVTRKYNTGLHTVEGLHFTNNRGKIKSLIDKSFQKQMGELEFTLLESSHCLYKTGEFPSELDLFMKKTISVIWIYYSRIL